MRNTKGQFLKGYKPIWTEKSRQKVSQALLGINTWSKGKKLSKKTRAKIKAHNARYWLGKKRPAMMGSNNPNWKEIKKDPLYKSIRESSKYKNWRLDILKRDNFICILCGLRGGKLQVDHYPKRFIDLFNESKIDTFDKAMNCKILWYRRNGRTLCIKCHKKTPTWGRLSRFF